MKSVQPTLMPEIDRVLELLEQAIPGIAPNLPNFRQAAEQSWTLGIRPIRAMVDAGLQISDLEYAIWSSKGFEYLAQLPGLVSADLVERIPPQ